MGAPFSFDTASEYLSSALIDTALVGDINPVALVAGQRVRVYRLLLNVHAAQLVTFKDSDNNVLLPQLSFGPTGALVLDFDGHPWLQTPLAKGLRISLANAVQTSGKIWYTQRGDSL